MSSRAHWRSLSMACAVIAGLAPARVSAQGSFPPGFVAEPVGDHWNAPVSLAFAGPGRLLVGEKDGGVWVVDHGERVATPLLDLTSEVLDNADRGLLCVQVDPAFAVNGYLYLLFVVDPNEDSIDSEQEAFGRLVRYTATVGPSGQLSVDPSSRLVLLGRTFALGIPSCHWSHAIGTIRFLSDGSLVCGAGDGAHYDFADGGGADPACFFNERLPADQDIGAFRAQYRWSLAGKLLRIDPATGLGLPDNPFYDGNPDDLPSRVWASGLRNPFRFHLRPGTGPREQLYIADVGWYTWEEIDLAAGGENFGWPCAEGNEDAPGYRALDQWGFCTGLTPSAPILAWNHADPGTLGFTGSCASGLVVYRGASYPGVYHEALFFTDYAESWMKVARLDANGRITQILPFADDLHGPVAVEADPISGDLFVISIWSNEILRLQYPDIASRPRSPR